MENISPKSRLATTLLAFLLGQFGAHRFYLGKYGTAVTMLVLAVAGYLTQWLVIGYAFLGLVWLWNVIDFVLAVAGIMRDKQGRLIKNW